tara:strand:+ start:1503 stop:1919 length:417 start_codon:yes stop_codon:yes gene_type:complete
MNKSEKLLEMISSRTKRIAKLINEGMPEVAIFWYYEDEVLGMGIPWKEGEDFGDFVNTRDDHASKWIQITKFKKELQGKEYFDIPRGRVVYNKLTKKFIVYATSSLLKDDSFKRKVRKEFRLPSANTEWKTDTHYEII